MPIAPWLSSRPVLNARNGATALFQVRYGDVAGYNDRKLVREEVK